MITQTRPPAPAVEQDVLNLVRQVLSDENLALDDDVFDKGATSLSFVRILARIRQQHSVTVSAPDLPAATPRHLAAQVAASLPTGPTR